MLLGASLRPGALGPESLRGRSEAVSGPFPGQAARSAAPAVPPGGNSPVDRAGLGSRGPPQPPGKHFPKADRGSGAVWGGVQGIPDCLGMGNAEDASNIIKKICVENVSPSESGKEEILLEIPGAPLPSDHL